MDKFGIQRNVKFYTVRFSGEHVYGRWGHNFEVENIIDRLKPGVVAVLNKLFLEDRGKKPKIDHIHINIAYFVYWGFFVAFLKYLANNRVKILQNIKMVQISFDLNIIQIQDLQEIADGNASDSILSFKKSEEYPINVKCVERYTDLSEESLGTMYKNSKHWLQRLPRISCQHTQSFDTNEQWEKFYRLKLKLNHR